MDSRVLKCHGLLNSVLNPHCSRGALSLAFWIVVKAGCYFIYVFSCFPSYISSRNVFLKQLLRFCFYEAPFFVWLFQGVYAFWGLFSLGKKKKDSHLLTSEIPRFASFVVEVRAWFWLLVYCILYNEKIWEATEKLSGFFKGRKREEEMI